MSGSRRALISGVSVALFVGAVATIASVADSAGTTYVVCKSIVSGDFEGKRWTIAPLLPTCRWPNDDMIAGQKLPPTTTTSGVTTTSAATTTTNPATTTSAATTTSQPATTTTTAPGCTGVAVVPRPDVQAVIDANPGGTTFCFQPGTYNISNYVRPKSGDRLISVVRRGAIFDGRGTVISGIFGSSGESGQHDVTVRGLVLRNFAGTYGSWPIGAIGAGYRWTVEDNELATSTIGFTTSVDTVLRGNWIHHNTRYGITGDDNNVLVENNEISFNNTGDNPADSTRTGSSGGSKFVGQGSNWSDGITLRGNWWHDNIGNAVWFDGNNRNVLVENELIENNTRIGLLYEVGDVGTIRNSTVRGNCTQPSGGCGPGLSLFHGAEIFVNTGSNVTIYGNTINARNNGIGGYDQDGRNDTTPEGVPVALRNLHVYDNEVTMPSGGTSGIVGSVRRPETYGGQNWFHANRYHVAGSAWVWDNGSGFLRTWAQWQALGQDLTGSVSP